LSIKSITTGLEVLPRQKEPVQATAAAMLIAAGNLVKSLLAAIRAAGKLYPIAITILAPAILPTGSYIRCHASILPHDKLRRLLSLKRCFTPLTSDSAPSGWSSRVAAPVYRA